MNFSNKKIDFGEKNLHYAVVRTKLALLRTFLLFCVSIKALIVLAASRHSSKIIFFGIFILIILTMQYIYTIEKLNKNEFINNTFFDYYPLIIIPMIFFLIYASWDNKKSF
tara:strand:- start:228 stop:560 length:333 start_codon:yes stop_codon:yes gene_type:complete